MRSWPDTKQSLRSRGLLFFGGFFFFFFPKKFSPRGKRGGGKKGAGGFLGAPPTFKKIRGGWSPNSAESGTEIRGIGPKNVVWGGDGFLYFAKCVAGITMEELFSCAGQFEQRHQTLAKASASSRISHDPRHWSKCKRPPPRSICPPFGLRKLAQASNSQQHCL